MNDLNVFTLTQTTSQIDLIPRLNCKKSKMRLMIWHEAWSFNIKSKACGALGWFTNDMGKLRESAAARKLFLDALRPAFSSFPVLTIKRGVLSDKSSMDFVAAGFTNPHVFDASATVVAPLNSELS